MAESVVGTGSVGGNFFDWFRAKAFTLFDVVYQAPSSRLSKPYWSTILARASDAGR